MIEITPSSDEDLLRRSVAGDEDAFVSLYRRRQTGIYRFALHMSGSTSVADEVTQEAFLTLIREGSRFDASRGSVLGYLYGVARKHILKRLEHDRRFTAFEDCSETSLPPGENDPL